MKTIKISESLFEDLIEYFDNKSDAEFNYENGKWIPNREMKLLCELSKEMEQYNGTTITKD